MKKWWWVGIGLGLAVLIIWGLINQTRTIDSRKLVPPTDPTPTVVVKESLKFGVMADIHNDTVSLKRGLEISKDRGELFVVIDGDMTLKGTESELKNIKKVLDDSKVIYYVVPGNHDLWQGEEIYKSVFGPTFAHSFATAGKAGEEKIIMINNASWKGLGREQKAWIEKETADCKVKFCIAIAHMPLNNNFSGHVMGEKSKPVTQEAKDLISLFNNNNVKELIAGHLHYATSYTLENIHTTIVGAVSSDRNNQTPRFTEFVIKGGELQREVMEIN